MKKFIVLLVIFFTAFLSMASAANTKLYRNTPWQFRIELPSDWEYTKTKGPNVVMNAMSKNIEGMNIVVKPMPDIAEANEDLLNFIFEYQEYPSNITIIGKSIIDVSPHKVLAYSSIIHFKYPRSEFYNYNLTFQIVTHEKHYIISYFCHPENAKDFQPIVLKSISSFVDETGWY